MLGRGRAAWILVVSSLLLLGASARVPRAPERPGVRPEINAFGDVEIAFVLMDATGAIDSVDAGGEQVGKIPGCSASRATPTADLTDSTDSDFDPREGSYFNFDQSARWPLELRWRGGADDTVSIDVFGGIAEGHFCQSGPMDFASEGGGRLTRVRIDCIASADSACSIRMRRLR